MDTDTLITELSPLSDTALANISKGTDLAARVAWAILAACNDNGPLIVPPF